MNKNIEETFEETKNNTSFMYVADESRNYDFEGNGPCHSAKMMVQNNVRA